MGIIRLLVIIVLFYLIYQILKGWIRADRTQGKSRGREPEDLVRDPVTGVYFPRSEGVAYLIEGRLVYFQNKDNLNHYLRTRQGNKKGG